MMSHFDPHSFSYVTVHPISAVRIHVHGDFIPESDAKESKDERLSPESS
jgi:hypothetical protein